MSSSHWRERLVVGSSPTAGANLHQDAQSEHDTAPLSADESRNCLLPSASIKITKVDGTPTGDVNEPISIQPNDNNGWFRVVDCKYMYNLATSSLLGVGTYTVSVVIDGVPAGGSASFDLR